MGLETFALRTYAALVTLLLLAGCGGPQQVDFVEFGQPENATKLTSLVAVLADLPRFSGQRVQVQGVLHIEFEGNQLCLDRAAVEFFVTTNCLSVWGLARNSAPRSSSSRNGTVTTSSS